MGKAELPRKLGLIDAASIVVGTVIGSATGSLMVKPTEEQRLAMVQTHEAPRTVGSHTVGAPDGGPGLPGVG